MLTMRYLPIVPALFGLSSFAGLLTTEFPYSIVPLVNTKPNTPHGTQRDAKIINSVHFSLYAFPHPANIVPSPAYNNTLKSPSQCPATALPLGAR